MKPVCPESCTEHAAQTPDVSYQGEVCLLYVFVYEGDVVLREIIIFPFIPINHCV